MYDLARIDYYGPGSQAITINAKMVQKNPIFSNWTFIWYYHNFFNSNAWSRKNNHKQSCKFQKSHVSYEDNV